MAQHQAVRPPMLRGVLAAEFRVAASFTEPPIFVAPMLLSTPGGLVRLSPALSGDLDIDFIGSSWSAWAILRRSEADFYRTEMWIMDAAPAIPETYTYAPQAEGLDLAYHDRLKRALAKILDRARPGHRAIDLGCGEGSLDHWLNERGFDVTGIDYSPTGINEARSRYPRLHFAVADICDPLASRLGAFPFVISLGVLEHLYSPRKAVDTAFGLCEPGGLFVCSVPFHGYWKDLAIALLGRGDQHYNPLSDHDHIKFFSELTLRNLLTERGFIVERMVRVGRIAPLAKDLIAVCRRPH